MTSSEDGSSGLVCIDACGGLLQKNIGGENQAVIEKSQIEKPDRDRSSLELSACSAHHRQQERERREQNLSREDHLHLTPHVLCNQKQGEVKEIRQQRRKGRRRGAKRYLTTMVPRDVAEAVACSVSSHQQALYHHSAQSCHLPVAEQCRKDEGKDDVTACQRDFSHRANEFYAALDLGTNNCRLLIAQPTNPGHFRVVDGFSRLVRLGEGISQSNRLKIEAMERTIEALKICREKLSRWNIGHQRLIATEACRSTVNGEEFIARVRCEAGLELEIVDRETEARLAVTGCGSLVERDTRGAILFDIGGGSSEIALLDMSKRHSPHLAEHIIAWTSLPVGVVTLAERFGADRVSYQDFRRMKAYVSELLYQFSERDRLGTLVKCPSFHLIGTSGTVTMLAGIHLNLKCYDRRRVDGMWLYGHEVSRICQKLLSWDVRQRAANPCIGAQRADLVLAGCAILEAIRTVWPSRRLRVADRGLREGILTELMAQQHAWTGEWQ